MELRQAECFLACREYRTFTAAARELNVVQSAVSTSIARLERELGVRLFDRSPTGLTLTEYGHAIVEPARAMLRARSEVTHAVEEVQGTVRGEVVVGSMINIVTINLARVISQAHRRFPDVTIQMRQSRLGSAGNLAGLRDGTLDLALADVSGDVAGLTVYPLANESMVLATHPDHHLAGGTFTCAELATERFIDTPPGWGTRQVLDRAIPFRHNVIEVAELNFGIELAAEGFGVTIVPQSVAELATRHGTKIGLATCSDAELIWRIAVSHLSARTPTAAALAVIDMFLRR